MDRAETKVGLVVVPGALTTDAAVLPMTNGGSIGLPQPMTSGVVYFSGKDIYYRSAGLPQPMISGVIYLFRENHILPLYGASAVNDRWGRLFI
jgi:hypothetical protein